MEIEYQGDSPLYYRVDFEPWQELPTDAEGRARIPVPSNAATITVSDRKPPDGEAIEIFVLTTAA